MNRKQKEKADAVATLKAWGVLDGTMVRAEVLSVSRSGMSRRVKLYIVNADGEMLDISWHAAKALEWTYCDSFPRGIRVGGCGMDMLFHTVDSLSYAMGYGSLCQEYDRTEPIEKRSGYNDDGTPVMFRAIGLRYRQI